MKCQIVECLTCIAHASSIGYMALMRGGWACFADRVLAFACFSDRTKGNKLFIEKKFDHTLSAYLEGVNYVRAQLQSLLSSKDNGKSFGYKTKYQSSRQSRNFTVFISIRIARCERKLNDVKKS